MWMDIAEDLTSLPLTYCLEGFASIYVACDQSEPLISQRIYLSQASDQSVGNPPSCCQSDV